MKIIVTLVIAIFALTASGFAGSGYPVSGKWTYDGATETGAAKTCNGSRTMTFTGDVRHDTVGSITEFRNKTSVQTGADLYRMVDTFYNGQIWGNVNYSLRLPDPDHIELNYVRGGIVKLRRCA